MLVVSRGSSPSILPWVAGGAVLVVGGFFLGRFLLGPWWKKRKTTQGSYLMGLDVLAAPYEALAGIR